MCIQTDFFEDTFAIHACPNWENQTIFTADNLHIMRGMNSNSVDLIYLDPPFNSNRQYESSIASYEMNAIFDDIWTLDNIDIEYLKSTHKKNDGEWHILQHARFNHSASMASYLTMMSPRLREMKRILKPTGSIYLHCDQTASHYLKGLMDNIFGAKNFQNEITWCYQLYAKGFKANNKYCLPRNKDCILYYALGNSKIVEKPSKVMNLDENPLHFNKDERGYYSTKPYNEGQNPVLKDNEELYVTRSGTKRIKRYVDNPYKMPLGDTWTDILDMTYHKKEYLNYPTQKPLELLKRIIETSSSERDTVFDPFCGCGTTCVAAEELGRKWIGIDISPKASQLVTSRIRSFENDLFRNWKCISRKDQPHRTDLEKLPDIRTHKEKMDGDQKGTRSQEEARRILKKIGWM